jgi:hypothetical protein
MGDMISTILAIIYLTQASPVLNLRERYARMVDVSIQGEGTEPTIISSDALIEAVVAELMVYLYEPYYSKIPESLARDIVAAGFHRALRAAVPPPSRRTSLGTDAP